MKKHSFSFVEIVCLLLGNLGQALAFDCFLAAHDIAAGGFGGLALVLSTIVPLSVGALVTIMSIPVFIWAYFLQGFRYTLSALLSTVAFSGMVDALSFLPTLTENRLLAAVFGGVLYGISTYILTRGHVAGTGTDLLARLLVTKFRHVTLGTLTLICDGVVVALSVVVFKELESGIYAIVTIAVMSYALDMAIKGRNKACIFQIVTDGDADKLAEAILREMDRGVTFLPAVGMYEKRERGMLMVAVSPREVYVFKDLIRRLCPNSFVMMIPASEVIGEGFRGLDVTVPVKKLKEKDGK